MGNSGSLHNVAIGLDENQYPYQYHHHQQYHNQPPSPHPHHNGHPSHHAVSPYPSQHPLHWTSSYSSTGSGSGPQSQPHIKVLPPEPPSSLLRLRPTTNGTILQSGGTLTGRRESFNPALLLQRSRTTLNESPGFSRRISDTSRKSGTPPIRQPATRAHPVLARRNAAGSSMEAAAKRFGSVPDLRISMEDEASMSQQSESHHITTAKTRPQSKGGEKNSPEQQQRQQQPQRKLRLFRTKAESRKLGASQSNDRPTKLAAEASDFHFQRQYRDHHRDEAKAKPTPPVFRREKSFDITLLRSRNKDPPRDSVPSPALREKSPVIRQRSVDSTPPPARIEGKSQQPPIRARKLSHSAVVEKDRSGRDLKRELEAVTTKRRTSTLDATTSMAKQQKEPSPTVKQPSSKSRVLSKIVPQLHKKEYRDDPIGKQPTAAVNDTVAESKLRTASKIPQLTKTFYFGMDKSPKNNDSDADAQIRERSVDRPAATTTQQSSQQSPESENFAKIQMEVIDQFAKSIFTTPEFEREEEESESSESALSSDNARVRVVGASSYIVGLGSAELPNGSNRQPVNNDDDHDADDDDDERRGQIQVHIRPTLPRRQLEIPRFSPAAAWRMLAEERFINGVSANSVKTEAQLLAAAAAAQTQPPVQLEGRIERIYREPNPMYPDNKSGDSGISGDAGLPERPESPKNREKRVDQVVGPFLSAWTPQQDLDEDDESSSTDEENHDEGGDDADGGGKEQGGRRNKYPSRGHTFSLSLPRENQLSIYEENKEKPGFNSLQKIKRTVTGVFANQPSNGNQSRTNTTYCNDNWLLSRSAPNSIESQVAVGTNGVGNVGVTGAETTRQSSAALGYLTAGKHVMYLPNHTETETTALPISSVTNNSNGITELTKQTSGKTRQREVQRNIDSSLDDPHRAEDVESAKRLGNSARKSRNGHRFTFQSTVRQIERRRIADKLSKEAEQMEAQRISELEAMRRVEEEFQRKRAGEKANIRHQLRLFSLEENQCISLPVDWQSAATMPQIDTSPNTNTTSSLIHHNQRAEPDGAVSSSPTSSPTLRPYSKTKIRVTTTTSSSSSANASPMHYRRKDDESMTATSKFSKSNARMRQPHYQPQSMLPPQTEILSEFRMPRREYFEYRSSQTTAATSNYRHKLEIGPAGAGAAPPLETQHNEIVCQIPFKGQPSEDSYGHEPDLNGNVRHYYHERRDSPPNEFRKMSR